MRFLANLLGVDTLIGGPGGSVYVVHGGKRYGLDPTTLALFGPAPDVTPLSAEALAVIPVGDWNAAPPVAQIASGYAAGRRREQIAVVLLAVALVWWLVK